MTEITERLKVAIADRYLIEHELGQGGMATVYLAHGVKHDRKVALKVLRPELAAVLGAERFVQEIKTTSCRCSILPRTNAPSPFHRTAGGSPTSRTRPAVSRRDGRAVADLGRRRLRAAVGAGRARAVLRQPRPRPGRRGRHPRPDARRSSEGRLIAVEHFRAYLRAAEAR
jgi:hypothetical protein